MWINAHQIFMGMQSRHKIAQGSTAMTGIVAACRQTAALFQNYHSTAFLPNAATLRLCSPDDHHLSPHNLSTTSVWPCRGWARLVALGRTIEFFHCHQRSQPHSHEC